MALHHVFRHRAFTLLILNRLFVSTATQIVSVTLGWQVYIVARLNHSIEQSAFLVGMAGLAQFLPMFALALNAGEAADRYNRAKILLWCTLFQLASTAVFIAQSGDTPALGGLFITAGFYGVARAFAMPASMALAPMLVPKDLLPQAIAWGTLSRQAGLIVGPWLAGLLCAISAYWSYVAAAVIYFVGCLAITGLLKFYAQDKIEKNSSSRLMMIREGLAYVWSNKIVFGAISLDLFAVFLGGATALLPVFARDVLHIGADGFGLLRSGPALGAGAVTLILSIRPVRRHAGKWMMLSVVAFGVATICFALSRWLWLSVVLLAILGGADSISVFVRQSLVQIVTPNNMRGRVSAVSSLFISASNELGEFESGVAARLLGPIGATIFGGAGSVAVVAIWSRLFPALRKADRLLPPEL